MSRSLACEGVTAVGNCDVDMILVGWSMKEIRSLLDELRFDDGVEERDPGDRRTCWM